MSQTTPVRRTVFRADVYTREVERVPDEPVTLYRGEARANKLVFEFVNQGRDVDPTGYNVLLSYLLPDDEGQVLDKAEADAAGELSAIVPESVYRHPGTVQLHCTFISPEEIVVGLDVKLKVLERADTGALGGVDAGKALPTYDEVLRLVLLLEEAIGLVDPTHPSSNPVLIRVEDLEAFAGRAAGFATAVHAHTGIGDDAPRIRFADLLGAPGSLSANGGNADTLGGNGPAHYATAEALYAATNATDNWIAGLESTVGHLATRTLSTYAHTKQGKVHNFDGSGFLGSAWTTAEYEPGDTFAVNGVPCVAYGGDGPLSELPANRWVLFIFDGYALNFKSGGAGLAVRVVGGTSQPESVAAGTIWVITDRPIAAKRIAPETTPPQNPAEGDVWISTMGTAGVPVALNGSVMALAAQAYQYSGGAWARKELRVFDGSQWIMPLMRLYEYGDSHDENSGGYHAEGNQSATTAYDLFVRAYANTEAQLYGYLRTIRAVDVTGWSRLRIRANIGAEGGSGPAYTTRAAWVGLSRNSDMTSMERSNQYNHETVSIDISLDVSVLSGTYYIGARVQAGGPGAISRVSITQMWLE